MITLKPCPFCGNDLFNVATDEYWTVRGYMPYSFVICSNCSACGPIAQRGTGSEEQCKVDAMRKWEARHG